MIAALSKKLRPLYSWLFFANTNRRAFSDRFLPTNLPSYERFRLHKIQSAISSKFFSNGAIRHYSRKRISSSYRKRRNRRLQALMAPVLDQAKFQKHVSSLPARFTNEELFNVLTLEDDPLVCFELFKWAGNQHRFSHDTSTFHIIIKKVGVAKMYPEMDEVVSQLFAVPHIGNEALFNSIIYFYAEARKLARAVTAFKHMKKSMNIDVRPSIKTYNILFTALLSRGSNSFINYVYMGTMSCLFRQMVNDDIEPDIYSLNSMVKGYVISLHVNEALRIFHQMGVVYNCAPNSFTYNYLIHGLCSQGRTFNASELCDEMKKKGFEASSKSYNSLVNAYAIEGDIDVALKWLWEMIGSNKNVDFITYKTLLEVNCRQGRFEEANKLLSTFKEKNLLDGFSYRKLVSLIGEDDEYEMADAFDRRT